MKNKHKRSGIKNKGLFISLLLINGLFIIMPLFIYFFINAIYLQIILLLIIYYILLIFSIMIGTYINNRNILAINKKNHDEKMYIEICEKLLNNYISNNKGSDLEQLKLLSMNLNEISLLQSSNIVLEEVNLKEFIENIYNIFKIIKNKITKNNIDLTLDLDINNYSIIINKSILYSLLYNLIYNAIVYNKDNGIVRIKIKQITHTNSIGIYKLIIEDTGVGINNKVLKKIRRNSFSKFKQKDNLGFNIIKSCLNKLNGTIDIVTKENIGTIINITLPIKYNLYNYSLNTSLNKTSYLPGNSVKEPKSIKILYVDGDESYCFLVSEYLKKFEIDIVKDGRSALIKYNKSYDLAIIDVNLPDISGINVIKKLKSYNPDAKIIPIINENTLDNDNYSNFLTKPFTESTLLQIIKQFN